jgi:phage baseplate assembly protein W
MEELGRRQKQAQGLRNVIVKNPLLRPQWPSMYRGPGLPKSNTSDIEPPEKIDVDLIFDSIRQIVETRMGERLMLPHFGSRIFELVGEPLSQVFEYKIGKFLTDSVKMWEPRCQVLNVSFVYDVHTVHVTYYLRAAKLGINAQSTFKIPR